jgi:uncharacterized protein YigA (DUF484 family)
MTGATLPRDEELSESAVAAWLAAHRDFFERHAELAGEMTLPHPVHDKTVSLVERQVSLLREQKLELKHKLQHLAQVARGNEQLLERLQKLILDLIDSRDLGSALELLETAMRRDFHADAVTVWIIQEEPREGFLNTQDPRLKSFRSLVEQGRPACGSLRPDQMAALFGEGTDVTSGALIPLCEGEGKACLGLLGVGSVDPKRFHPEMGTVFLAHLGAVAARVIRARLSR